MRTGSANVSVIVNGGRSGVRTSVLFVGVAVGVSGSCSVTSSLSVGV